MPPITYGEFLILPLGPGEDADAQLANITPTRAIRRLRNDQDNMEMARYSIFQACPETAAIIPQLFEHLRYSPRPPCQVG
jgi:hypothetical protein